MLQSMETKGVNQIVWILLHSNGFPKACNRMWTSNILGLPFFFTVVTEISKQLGWLQGVFMLKFQNIYMQSKQFPYNIMWDLGLSTSGFAPATENLMPYLCRCLWTYATKSSSLQQKKKSRILIQANFIQEIVSLHSFWKTMLQVS